ncbi:polysaccharide biosynthesis tyrosine autokinase [Mycolicibacterium sp. NCC-Tsukiji]|uniref:polysaccharide biosynthesis tyrosine autokinase n=1 Tax=Mycolicibacterium sp. NCC-Tsukiji TaxID=2185272 RepID=UPI000EE564C4|nr:polysaccharide biosynthesis tyrosine autokinase [Mycolicibacterium sp. NCC-Tsukiji]GCA99482.1 Etk tyrosine kinase [Mycolicibacterium sp. NCC-Tsukiji]
MKVRGLARRWWPIGLLAVIGLAGGLALAAATPKAYTATATLFVGSAVSPDSAAAYNLDLFSQQRTLTYSRLIQSRDIATRTIKDLGLDMSPEELSAKISATPVPKTVLMRLSATARTPSGASDIANMFTNEFALYVSQLETPKGAKYPSAVVTVVERAAPPTSPTSPNATLYGLAGLGVGVVLGLLVSYVLRFLDRGVRTSKEVSDVLKSPVLAELPREPSSGNRKLNVADTEATAYGEAIRKLRAKLLYATVDSPPRVIALVAAESTMATTATAANLAVVMDRVGRQVVLVEGDMREPRLGGYLGELTSTRSSAGSEGSSLCAVLTGDVSTADALLQIPDTGVDVLLAGAPSNSGSDALATDALAKLFTELRSSHDVVLCDTPGLLSVVDAIDIGRVCDGVLFVVPQGKIQKEQLSAAADALRSVGVNVIGAVLTDVR